MIEGENRGGTIGARCGSLGRLGSKLATSAPVEFHVVMGPEDLKAAGLDALGKKWGQD